MDNPLVSICVPHWNHAEDILRPFLENIVPTLGKETELIICDNGSTDHSKEILELYKKETKGQVVPVYAGQNLGFGGGSNLAYQKARGKYIIFLNNDVRAKKPDWIRQLVKVSMERNDNAVLGAQLVKNNSWTVVLDSGIIPYINGWCMFFPRKILEKIGTFDTGVGKAFFEDVELSDRAAKAGYELRQVDGIGLEHLGSQTIKSLDAGELTERARKYYRAKMIFNKIRFTGKKRIVFYVPNNYKFVDSDWEGKGVGGAEYALIHLTRMLVKLGLDVWVYNDCPVQGVFNGVNYAHRSTFEYSDYCDVFVLFREPIRNLEFVNSPIKIFWSCDQQTSGKWEETVYPFIDKIVAISDHHKQHLRKWRDANSEFVEVIDLGIDLDSYLNPIPKIEGKMIFCSVPHRGLAALKSIYPKIKQRFPKASLVITSDYTLWGVKDPDNAQYKNLGEMPDVIFLGKISRSELVRHQLESEIMIYPCNYEELFCVAAAECIAAGAVPVSVPIGALKTTIADSGVLIRDGMGNFEDAFVDAVVDLLTNTTLRSKLMVEGRTRMFTKYNWKVIAEKWLELFDQIRDHKEEGGESLWQSQKNKNVELRDVV